MKGKTIALIDFYNGGHREAFMQFFAKALLESGYEVICVMPTTQSVKDWLANNTNTSNIRFFDITNEEKLFHSFGRLNFALSRILFWRKQAKTIRFLEQQTGKKMDMVYFNWLDSLMANYLPASIVDAVFPYKWSGLYFHPVIFRMYPEFLDNKTTFRDVDAVFLSKNCIGITMHDEGMLDAFSKRIGKKVLLFPEIADSTPPTPLHTLAGKIKEKAAGRTIVGIIGLEPHKGALSMMRIAKIADPTQFFFAFTGVYNEQLIADLPDEDRTEFLDFEKNLPDNCLWETGSLKEGEDYNSVFCSFDVIHIVYKGFYSSSNRLTKAAIFHKLVLASNYGCVGEDVPKYDLGAVADENNIEEQYQQLQQLRNRILQDDLPTKKWEIYAAKHSASILPEKFEELINLLK